MSEPIEGQKNPGTGFIIHEGFCRTSGKKFFVGGNIQLKDAMPELTKETITHQCIPCVLQHRQHAATTHLRIVDGCPTINRDGRRLEVSLYACQECGNVVCVLPSRVEPTERG